MNSRVKIAASLGLLSAAMFVNASEAGEILPLGFSFTDNYHTTDVAGLSGETRSTPKYGHYYGLFGFRLTERNKRTCSLTAKLEHISDNEKYYADLTVHRCGSKGPNSKKKRIAEQEFLKSPVTGAVHFATSMEVCLNSEGTMIRGIKLQGRKLNVETGQLDPIEGVNQWTDDHFGNFCPTPYKLEQKCPAGWIAVGFEGHYADSEPPRSLTGIALRCRQLEFVDQNGKRPVS